MPQYKVCPKCGANLDPGEKCSCEKQDESVLNQFSLKINHNDSLIKLIAEQINMAEQEAFLQGFNMAMNIARGRDNEN